MQARTFRIGERELGPGKPPLIVAEMSGNHNQSLDRAIARTDADVVWFNLGLTMFGTTPAAVTAMVAPLTARLRGRRTVVTLHELPAMADLRPLSGNSPTT